MATLREPDWTLWRTFLAVFRDGSLSAAARSLGLTQPTVGRHVDELEAALGTALFTRSRFGLRPTPAAEALVPGAEAMASHARALLRVASGKAGEVEGAVRISASEVVGAEVLPAMVGGFRERHPGVAVELVLSNEAADLVAREVDIAIRMVRPSQSTLVARKIGVVALGLHAHRRYLDVHGTPRNADDLSRHAVIGFDTDTASVRSARARGISVDRGMFSIRTDSDLAQLAAIRAGIGIGVCQVGIARRDPDLVRVLPDLLAFELDIWVAMHEDLRAIRRMRLMFDHLAEALAAFVAGSRP